MKRLYEIIDSLYDKYIKVWQDVCKIESPTAYKEGVDAVGNYFIEMAKELGLEYEIHKEEVSGNAICITLNGDVDAKPFALSGHIDTVFPVGTFGVSVDNGKIYGPGVCDCKGGVVMSMMVLEALKLYGFRARPVMLLIQSDEENSSTTSGKATVEYICKKAKDAVGFFNMEGSNDIDGADPSSSADPVCLWRKGIVSYEFNVHGIAAHSSKSATEGASAILEAAHKILALEKYKDKDGITCNCGVISGGTVRNTVPEHCRFVVDIRYATKEQFYEVQKFVKDIADDVSVSGCRCEVKQLTYRTAMEKTERNLEFLDKVNAILESSGFIPLKAGGSPGGSDAADVTAHGIPCIDKLGATGKNVHSTDEYALLSSLDTGVKKLATVIYNIGD